MGWIQICSTASVLSAKLWEAFLFCVSFYSGLLSKQNIVHTFSILNDKATETLQHVVLHISKPGKLHSINKTCMGH